MSEEAYYTNFPKERIDKRSPYYRCAHCKRDEPEINGRLKGHAPDCAYRLKMEAQLGLAEPGNPVADALAWAENSGSDWERSRLRISEHKQEGESATDAALRILATEVRRLTTLMK